VTRFAGGRWPGGAGPSGVREEVVMSEDPVPLSAQTGQPSGLLDQMEELLAALNAALTALGADLRSAAARAGHGAGADDEGDVG
jgi:ABC-type transporter Mla subunit MlaD